MANPPSAPSPLDLAAMPANVAAAAKLMKLLSSEQRLMLLCRLGEGEASAGELADYAGLAQSAASQHLAKLRDAGVVETRRDGQMIYYRLADDGALRVVGLLCDIYRPGPGAARR